ncbi:MAG TPA: type 1 glutamine amidotransferase domain-containing protein [Thermoanaerobaculia bacterium]|nr:type 1 glutamine amidotransferase domain-containing protein [Thermoanaerobaculia bacterium]
MAKKIDGMRVAILATEGFEQSELLEPKKALEKEGAVAEVVSPKAGKIRGWEGGDWGKEVDVDVLLEEADPSRYEALVLPGGVMNPDKLRMNPRAVAFVKSFVESGKPIAAICHGPWTLIEAGAARGRRMTSWPSLQTDLRNAGAQWVDEEAVVDDGIVTSRKPADLPAFHRKMLEEFEERRHARAGAETARTRA